MDRLRRLEQLLKAQNAMGIPDELPENIKEGLLDNYQPSVWKDNQAIMNEVYKLREMENEAADAPLAQKITEENPYTEKTEEPVKLRAIERFKALKDLFKQGVR